jgi:PIN domain nuclease of toxin-antitoxin system
VRALLDTHTFLWWISGDPHLTSRVRRIISDPSSELFLGYGSLWEATIKIQKGTLKVPGNSVSFLISEMKANGIGLLPLRLEYLTRLESLPLHHRDPFDRLLVAQALEEDLAILTADNQMRQYPARIVW